MNPQDWIGSTVLRIVALGLAAAAAVFLISAQRSAGSPVAGLVLAFVAFIVATHWSSGIYAGWMSIAQRIQTVVVTLLFALCYFTVVPPLWVYARATDSLGLRERESHWKSRRSASRDLEAFQRLG